jgi:hypothetical protein
MQINGVLTAEGHSVVFEYSKLMVCLLLKVIVWSLNKAKKNLSCWQGRAGTKIQTQYLLQLLANLIR